MESNLVFLVDGRKNRGNFSLLLLLPFLLLFEITMWHGPPEFVEHENILYLILRFMNPEFLGSYQVL